MSDLAIVLPGGGYTALGPAIRFPVLAAEESGYQSIVVEYPPEAIRAQDISSVVQDVRRQIGEAVSSAKVDRMAVIAKSLGTRVVVQVADLLHEVNDLSVVWLTPLFGDAGIRGDAIESGWRSLIVAGAQDPLHDEAGATAVALALDSRLVRLPGADHALEVSGDVLGTIHGLQSVAVEVREFLRR